MSEQEYTRSKYGPKIESLATKIFVEDVCNDCTQLEEGIKNDTE